MFDPQTVADRYARSAWIVIAIGLVFVTTEIDDQATIWLSYLLAVLAMTPLVTFNEFWLLDRDRRTLSYRRRCLTYEWATNSWDFEEIQQVALSGHYHFSSNGSGPSSRWWEYGVAFLTGDGSLHRLFPSLSRDYKGVYQACRALADTLETTCLAPEPRAELIVSGRSLTYKDSRPVAGSPNRDLGADWELREEAADGRLEFLKEEDTGPQRGCASSLIGCASFFGLFALPFLLGDLAEKITGGILVAVTLGPLGYGLSWFFNPILKTIYSIEGSGKISAVQIRKAGRRHVKETNVPVDARVVLEIRETVHRPSRNLLIKVDDQPFYYFTFVGGSREELEEKGRRIAEVLGREFQVESDADVSEGSSSSNSS